MDFTQCIMQSVYVINCIEVLVMTSIVGECWIIICHYIVRDYILLSALASFTAIVVSCAAIYRIPGSLVLRTGLCRPKLPIT